jgi:hypothetical protein
MVKQLGFGDVGSKQLLTQLPNDECLKKFCSRVPGFASIPICHE